MTHTTSQELLLTQFTVHETLEFEIFSAEKHFCHEEFLEFLFRAEVFRPVHNVPEVDEFLESRDTHTTRTPLVIMSLKRTSFL